MKAMLSILLSLILILTPVHPVQALCTDRLHPQILMPETNTATPNPAETSESGLTLETPSAILMEASTGTILFEKDSHQKLRPASITKIMTLILIFEALEKGQIHLSDTVSVSEHAASMGGSQVFLELGEQQSVEDLIKCISISSANDACVAMAEYIGGSEDAFVQQMNQKAQSLGMNDTNFVNCCGLEADGHLTCAYDIALMSRELSVQHPQIYDYCTIWMDTITHNTRKGSTEFGLTNTNKLIRYYSYATGLKTGYTSQSKYCLAATATKNDVDLISVVMAEPTPQIRTKETIALLDYGFAHTQIYQDDAPPSLPDLTVKKGTAKTVPLSYQNNFTYVITDSSSFDTISSRLELPDYLEAPVKEGDTAGTLVYLKNGEEIGSVPILAAQSVEVLTLSDCFLSCLQKFFCADEALQ